jgi:hypothetical protein
MIIFDAEKLRNANEVCVVKRIEKHYKGKETDTSVYPYPLPESMETALPLFRSDTASVKDVATLLTLIGLDVYIINPTSDNPSLTDCVLFEPKSEPQQTTSVNDSFKATLLKAAEEHKERRIKSTLPVGSNCLCDIKPIDGDWVEVTTMGSPTKRWIKVS